MNKHIEQAIENLRSAAVRVERPERYYDGRHDLRFATEKFENTFGTLFREFALNLCPAVCDALRDKLRITGFSVDRRTAGSLPASDIRNTQAGSLRSDISAIWHRNRMPLRTGEVHKEVLKNGDAYMIAWPDAQGRARFYPNRAANVTVAYDEEDAGRVLWAAKAWIAADKYVRLNLFYPDRIEKYVSKEKSEGILPEAKSFVVVGARASLPARGEDGRAGMPALPAIANPYGVVPVFHFANNADLGTLGRSELEGATGAGWVE